MGPLVAILRTRTTAEWEASFAAAAILPTRLDTAESPLAAPHLVATGFAPVIGHPRRPDPLSGAARPLRRAPA